MNYESGTWKNIHYGDILTLFPTLLDVNDVSVPYISSASFSSKAALSSGDVIMADTAEDYTAGKALEIIGAENTKTVPGLHTIACHPTRTFSSGFLGYYLNSFAYRERIKPFIQGIKVCSISKGNFLRSSLSFPSIQEQAKIGSFLSLLDKRIEVQNKIIEELLALKKALYNKVFGTDAFNCRDIALHHFMKMPDKVREMHPDRHKLITVRLNEGGVIKNTNVETLKMASTIYYRRSAGQFIYGKQNIFHGAFGIVPCHLDGYASSGDVPALDFKEGVNSSFLMRSLSFSCYNWEKYASGTGSKRIHEKNCLNCKFECPHWALSKDSKKCSQP